MLDVLNTLEHEGLAGLASVSDGAALEAWRVEYLGSKGRLKGAMGGLKDVPREEKPAVGKRSNEVKQSLESAFKQRTSELGGGGQGGGKQGGPAIDVTEPGYASGVGRRHILTRVREELCDVFARMGFAVAEGPELEDDEHNFVKLNIPEDRKSVV